MVAVDVDVAGGVFLRPFFPPPAPTSPWPHLGSPQATTNRRYRYRHRHRHHRRRTGGPCGGRDVSGSTGRDEIYTHLRNNLRLMTCVCTT